MRLFIFIFIMGIIVSCNNRINQIKGTDVNVNSTALSPGGKIIHKSIQAHGGAKYDKAHFSFVFRGKEYRFKNNGDEYMYQVTDQKEGVTKIDILDNNGFARTENGKKIDLSEKDQRRYENALNSVIYFATLPHKLHDKAVNKNYIGTTSIKEKEYDIVEVTFSEEGGGVDYDDTFYYWISKQTNLIDYLAYNYHVNNGGVRFRTAYNMRRVGGIVFQDYINYKAEVGTPLSALSDLWEANKLKELSKIETEKVTAL